jgi:hypothetical protein
MTNIIPLAGIKVLDMDALYFTMLNMTHVQGHRSLWPCRTR